MRDARDRLAEARLYGILDMGYVALAKVEETTRNLLEGGADLLQLRAKGWDEAAILRLGEKISPLCRSAGVPFVVNDYPSVAIELGADGLHLGQDDGSYGEARRRVGNTMIIGRSTHSLDQARKALDDGFDYIGFGPLFPTPTKEGRPGIGIRNIATVESEIGMEIPVFCIGGIRRDNLLEVTGAGARRVVIVSDLLRAEDMVGAVRQARACLADG